MPARGSRPAAVPRRRSQLGKLDVARLSNGVIGNVHRGAVVAVRKSRPAQGQRQAQVILGGVEPVQQIGVPGRRPPRRLLRVGLAETIRVAAELPAAFAHAPPGPLAVVQMLCFVGKIVGLAGAEMPGAAR